MPVAEVAVEVASETLLPALVQVDLLLMVVPTSLSAELFVAVLTLVDCHLSSFPSWI
jgi:hypothetical protein